MAMKGSLLFACRQCRQHQLSHTRRAISTTTSLSADEPQSPSSSRLARRFIQRQPQDPPAAPVDPLAQFSEIMSKTSQRRSQPELAMTDRLRSIRERAFDESLTRPGGQTPTDEPYHLTVFSHKHNLHLTFSEPSRNPILSFSNGNLGLRKAQRATYDAAYQLCAYTFRKMAEKSWRLGGAKMTGNQMLTLADVAPGSVRAGIGSSRGSRTGPGPGIEVIFRGYGPGREAFQKALLGNEGRMIKPLVVKVTDGTRLKFGGTRSPQVRRLG